MVLVLQSEVPGSDTTAIPSSPVHPSHSLPILGAVRIPIPLDSEEEDEIEPLPVTNQLFS